MPGHNLHQFVTLVTKYFGCKGKVSTVTMEYCRMEAEALMKGRKLGEN